MCLNAIYSKLTHLLRIYLLPQLVIYYLLCIYWNNGIYWGLLRMLFIVVVIYLFCIYSHCICTVFLLYLFEIVFSLYNSIFITLDGYSFIQYMYFKIY